MADSRDRRAAPADGMVRRDVADRPPAPGKRSVADDRLDCADICDRWAVSRFRALAAPLGDRASTGPADARSDSSFDAATLAKFEEATGIAASSGLDTVSARAAWIRGEPLPREWVDFKCKVVTDFVGEARNALEGGKARCGARNLCRARRRWAHRAADRPALS